MSSGTRALLRESAAVPPAVAFVGAALTVAAIGAVDWVTGPSVSFLAFYLVPTSWVTVQAGRWAGVAMAVLCVVASFIANVALQNMSDADTELWNAALRLVTFVLVVELVYRARQQALVARESERHSQEFLASAAHQLRTPLAGIQSTVDALLIGGDFTPEQEHLLVNLNRETSRAGRHLSSLLRMARLDQHEEVPYRRVQLDDVVRVELERAAAARPGLAWELSREQEANEVECNPDSIGEALANLFDNAARHARSRVEAAVSLGAEHVEIAVRDDGPGLPAGAVTAVFERFVSLDRCGGTGLGLPIARGIAEAHKGTLDYREGAFVIRLPRWQRALVATA
jgi:signal transduction histidine kinase